MSEKTNVTIDKEEIISAFENVYEKINGYVANLKQKSSDEILNGSLEKAQQLLNELVPYESVIKKLSEAKELFNNIQNGSNGNEKVNEEKEESNSEQQEGEEDNVIFDPQFLDEEDENKITPEEDFRIPMLKGLIYLGGSAAIDEVIGFVKKDMKNKLTAKDTEVINEDGLEKWHESLLIESERMVEEGLITNEKKEGYWEIVQKGIDYLAKHGK